ncbi:putative UPF0481 protein At3g02645 [Manihot esculenta]|uniref:Uncharacterized protein n=2 Tax=Manihot esculenta TaxID=3983 RepID=A0ACB7GVS8_MANES|nr:putative UPF0481 protein At3g02645 [Manihot esculenta]KAG8643733.1 hypothetical protein MANES_11G062600v8 [Manihot esculenta]
MPLSTQKKLHFNSVLHIARTCRSSIQSIMSWNPSPNFDEHLWIINIRRSLEEELENDSEVPVSIFNVPKILMATDPDSYTPQEVAIGPYHHWRPELYEMERYKLAAAKRTQKQLQNLKFQHIVDHLTKLEPRVRACYHKFLDFSNETLAWMMAIDASFLLEFLQIYAVKEGMAINTGVSSRMSHLVDYAGTKSAHNAILRDMVMLENQIPLFVLRKILEVQFFSLETADELLLSMLVGFCNELSPFKLMNDMQKLPVSQSSHLLDYLYIMIAPTVEAPAVPEIDESEEQGEAMQSKGSYGNSSHVKDLFSEIWKLISKLNKAPIQLLKRLIFSRPVKLILKLPWTILSNLPGMSVLKQPIQYLFFAQDKEELKPENDLGSSNEVNKPPLVEEITIPCVTDLANCGVRFLPTTGNISSINFDPKTVSFYLPIVSLDVNTEVVLRNLVAYEASNASGPLVFTRYTELMNGIIDTEEDVKFLREKGIILNHLKSDGEVAELWNGMSKSIRLTKVPFLDKVIEDVNKYYNGKWKIKVGNFMKRYVFGSWQFLTFLAAIFLLMLMTLQAFCSVYSCGRLFHHVSGTT